MSNKLRLFSKPLNNLVRSNFGFKSLIQQKSNLIISNNVRFEMILMNVLDFIDL